ncbi:MAG: rod shape-determining protein MreC [Syntrophomonadaceae bacterium]|nr:rod shape-determining protein MreC [Syntrophomonadaceae bacterium]
MFKLFKSKFFWLLLLVIVISIMVMNATAAERGNITFLEKVIRDTYVPLQSGVNSFRNNWDGWTAVFSDKSQLQKQIKLLEAENSRLTMENQSLQEYKQESFRLRKMLNFDNSNREKFDLLPAHLIARSPNNWYECITIDRGLRQGVQNGMPVISPGGLVGCVGSVSENSAQVNLITDREMAVGAIIQKTRETNGIVEGLGDSNELRMINIPYYSKISEGDRIISSGLSATYPPGINIGTVTEVTREPNGLLQVAMIKPAVDFNKLEEVFVITGYHPVEGFEVEEE